MTPTRFATVTPVELTPTPTATLVPTATPIRSMMRTSRAQLPPERIIIPSIDLDAPVVPMAWKNVVRDDGQETTWDVPADAAGFQVGSAVPGQSGNTVISGHHNIEGKVFENLRKVVPGDLIYLHTAEDIFHYVVEERFLLRERGISLEQQYQNARWIGPTEDERLTLVTCWPPTDNAYRLIIIAKPQYLDGS